MTGFGVGDATLAEGRVVAELRSVNQRFLEVRARLPRELVEHTLSVEQMARERLKRGRVEIVVHAEGPTFESATLDLSKARAAFAALATLRDEIAPGEPVPLSVLAAVPDLFVPRATRAVDEVRAALRLAIERALEAMEAMRAREGAAIAEELVARTAEVERRVAEIVDALGRAREAARRRAREKVARVLAESAVAMDERRLEAEILLLAERIDVAEEVARLGSHAAQFRAAIDAKEPVGRRLDFLLQEMLREANTLGAKAQDAEVSQTVVAIKVELERMREQTQNVE